MQKSTTISQLVKRAGRFQTRLPQELGSITTTTNCTAAKLLHEKEDQSVLTTDQSVSTPNWKFVNKYQNRHSGGIPIFSEERLQERKEKVRLLILFG